MPMTVPITQAFVPKTVILAISGNQTDLGVLRCLFAGSNWKLCTAGTIAEACEWLRSNPTPAVLCEARLTDGDWKAFLRAADGLENPPMVVVTSRHADEKLWTEALNLGAFDVLACPARQAELFSEQRLANLEGPSPQEQWLGKVCANVCRLNPTVVLQ